MKKRLFKKRLKKPVFSELITGNRENILRFCKEAAELIEMSREARRRYEARSSLKRSEANLEGLINDSKNRPANSKPQ